MKTLHNRSFLTLLDFTPTEIIYLIDLAIKLKSDKKNGTEKPLLTGKNIALIFEKDSTRTRCAFEVAANDQGAFTTYLGSSGSHIGSKESIKDTARVLGRMYDGIEFRGYSQESAELLAEYSKVPVWNGLTDSYHPTQALADFMTIMEIKGTLKGLKITFVGDCNNNVAISLMIASAKLGVSFVALGPKELAPNKNILSIIEPIAKSNNCEIIITEALEDIKNVDIIYTDVWVSMGEKNWQEKINLLRKYQVNDNLVSFAKNDYSFLHCLPAFHNLETKTGSEMMKANNMEALEVTESVFESNNSAVFDQAENRLHTIKAVMVATLSQLGEQ